MADPPPAPSLPLPQPTPLSDPLAHARIQCLLVPVGPVRQSVWERWSRAIRGYGEIRLSDVPGTSGNVKGGRARYLPPSFPPAQTHLHLSFTTLPPSPSLLPLSLFQVSLFPLAVIGITDLSDTSRRWSRAERVAEFDRLIGDVFPPNQVFPLTRRCFGVEEDVYEELERPASRAGEPLGRVEESGIAGMVEIDASDGGRATPTEDTRWDRRGFEEKLVVIPQEGNVEIVLGMLMADVCASVLTELGEMATALESPSGASTLQSSLLPTITVKPIPKATNGRPRSVNGYHHLAVSSNVIPPPARSPSPAIPVAPAPHHSFSASQPNLMDKELPAVGKTDAKALGSGIKRSTTGLGFASVTRVVSGKTEAPAPTPSGSAGRLKKLQADFWLLSGRLTEAAAGYTDALSSLKSSNDHLWQASALEGLATTAFLEAWEGRSQSDAHIPFTSSAIMQTVHEHLMAASAAYSRTACPPPSLFAHGTVNGEEIMARLHVSLALRHARLLFLTWAACGFGTPSMNAAVYQQLPRSYPPLDYARKGRVYVRLTQMSRISRQLISSTAGRAHGPWLDSLPDNTRLEAFVTLAGLARLTGMERKEAFFLREVAGCAVGMLGLKRAQDSLTEQPGANGDVVSPELGSAVSAVLTGRIATRRKESTEGNEALSAMLHRVSDIFGLDLYRTARADRPAYGWSELQVEIAKEAVLLSETLPDPRQTVSYAQLALRTLSPHLPAGYQLFFLQRSLRALETARRRGIDVEDLDWWLPEQLVQAVRMVAPAPTKQLKAGQRGLTITAAREVFLYHPSLRQPDEKEHLIPCNEAAEYRITLRNPFAFDLEIKDMALVFEGPSHSADPMRVVMAPFSTQTIPYSVLPNEAGSLVATGCSLTLPDGIRRIAPLPPTPSDPSAAGPKANKRERHRSKAASAKRTGLGLRPGLQLRGPLEQETVEISATVVAPQPTLVIKSTTLTHGSAIVCEGETTSVTVHVENVSDTAITYMKLRFDDNTAEAARLRLAEDTNTAESRFNIERELLDRPVMRWHKPENPRIPPHATAGLVVECLGKAGSESAIIEVEYGTDVGDTRYTRQLICPVLLTVRPTLQVVNATMTPLESIQQVLATSPAAEEQLSLDVPNGIHASHMQRRSSSFRREAESDTQLAEAIGSAQKAGHSCLLQVDVYNAYNNPLEGFLASKASDAPAVSRRLVKPGAIERLYLPMSSIQLGADEIEEAIPALSERQFVVERSQGSRERDMQQRAIFWYKRALLDQLEMTWAEPGSTRHGTVDANTIVYTQDMHRAFKQEDVTVQLVLRTDHKGAIQANDFVSVGLVVDGGSSEASKLPLLYRIDPLAMSARQPSWADLTSGSNPPLRLPPGAAPIATSALKHLALDGYLEGRIEAEAPAPTFGCCFLAAGEYAFRAAVYTDAAGDAPRQVWFSPELRVHVS